MRDVDGEPFDEIVAVLADLPEDGRLRLIDSFEPEPVYGVLEQREFAANLLSVIRNHSPQTLVGFLLGQTGADESPREERPA